jgi:hypothetical protein
VRIKFLLSLALVTLTATAALADPPQKKPTYLPPEQSSTIGVLGGHHTDASGPAPSREPAAPAAAPEVPKVDAEPPAPLAAPERFEVHPEGGQSAAGVGPAMMAVPKGPPPSGFLPDHPFISGIVAGLIGGDLGSMLYGGPMMGDEDGVLIGYGLRVGVILLLAYLIFRAISQRASGVAEPAIAPPRRREPSFERNPDIGGGGRREPTFGRPKR